MGQENIFTNVDDAKIGEIIRNASRRVVFAAPGFHEDVADALVRAFGKLEHKPTVIIDVEPEVYQLGYGTESALQHVKAAAAEANCEILKRSGLRIGLLLADEQILIFTPTPLLIEAGPQGEAKPNAIILSSANVSETVLNQDGAVRGALSSSPVEPEEMKALTQALEASPPKPFDLARRERVFNSTVNFVEFAITGHQLGRKKIKLDPEILGLADDYLKARVENTFKPFEDDSFLEFDIESQTADGKTVKKKFSPVEIEQARRLLRKEFFFEIPKTGSLIKRRSRPEFENRVELLKKDIATYSRALLSRIEKETAAAKSRLVEALLPRVQKDLPLSWRKHMDSGELSDEVAKRLLESVLNRAFQDLIKDFHPQVTLIYKDATYETIRDPEFIKHLEKAFGPENAANLFSEHDVAPEARTNDRAP